MSVELKTYSGDRRLEIGGAEAIRKPIYADNWTRLRIGLQLSFNGVASSISGTPRFAFGVCNGNANVQVAATADHVVGFKTNVTTMTYSAGPPSYFSWTAAHHFFKKVGVTETTSAFTSIFGGIVNTTANRSGWFIEIVKGSPNFSMTYGRPIGSAPIQADMTDDQFQAVMELASFSDIGTIISNYGVSTTITLAVDEVANGVLNNLFVYWERTSHLMSFNIRHRKVA